MSREPEEFRDCNLCGEEFVPDDNNYWEKYRCQICLTHCSDCELEISKEEYEVTKDYDAPLCESCLRLLK